MNKIKLFCAVVALTLCFGELSAKSLKDLFSSGSTASDVVTSVTGGLTVSNKNIVGKWDYIEPAIELKSDKAATDIAGSVLASQIEDKLSTYCSKVGITAGKFAFVFNSDGTFTSNVGTKSIGGTYSVDSENGTIALSYKAINKINIGTLTAETTLSTNSLALVFPADKLLKLLSAIASKSSRPELKSLSSFTEKYDGISLGFSLSGKAVIGAGDGSVATDVEKAVNAFGKLF